MWRLSLHKVTTFLEIAGVIAGTAGETVDAGAVHMYSVRAKVAERKHP